MKFDIYDILTLVFFVLSLIFFFWYLFGNSPTFEQTLLVFILGVAIANFANLRFLRTDHNNLKRSFFVLARDFKEHVKSN